MTIETAINRFTWRLRQDENGKFYNFQPNQKDVEAMNRIIEWVNDAKEQSLENNQGFAKLYITTYVWQLQKHSATPMDNFVQAQLHKMLEKPLAYFTKRATQEINEIEMKNFHKEHGILQEEKHPLEIPEEQKKATAAKIQELIKDPGNRAIFLGEAWGEDEVEQNLLNMASEALIKYKL